jgi:uncharacterized protein YqeY
MNKKILGMIKKAILSKNDFELNLLRLAQTNISEEEYSKTTNEEINPIDVLDKMIEKRNNFSNQLDNNVDLYEINKKEIDFLNNLKRNFN